MLACVVACLSTVIARETGTQLWPPNLSFRLCNPLGRGASFDVWKTSGRIFQTRRVRPRPKMNVDVLCHSLTDRDEEGGSQCIASFSRNWKFPDESMYLEDASASEQVAKGHALFLVPGILHQAECEELMAAAADHVARVPPTSDSSGDGEPRLPSQYDAVLGSTKRRIAVAKMPRAHALCDTLIRRVLTLVEQQLPTFGRILFGTAKALDELSFRFSLNEPAINVYQEGAGFDEHEDNHMLTILVPLSEQSAFAGGGTAFWPTAADAEVFSLESYAHRARKPGQRFAREGQKVVVRPAQGTAILFVGSVTHAGVVVSAGERMVFVCSFNLLPRQSDEKEREPGQLIIGNRTLPPAIPMAPPALEGDSPRAGATAESDESDVEESDADESDADESDAEEEQTFSDGDGKQGLGQPIVTSWWCDVAAANCLRPFDCIDYPPEHVCWAAEKSTFMVCEVCYESSELCKELKGKLKKLHNPIEELNSKLRSQQQNDDDVGFQFCVDISDNGEVSSPQRGPRPLCRRAPAAARDETSRR